MFLSHLFPSANAQHTRVCGIQSIQPSCLQQLQAGREPRQQQQGNGRRLSWCVTWGVTAQMEQGIVPLTETGHFAKQGLTRQSLQRHCLAKCGMRHGADFSFWFSESTGLCGYCRLPCPMVVPTSGYVMLAGWTVLMQIRLRVKDWNTSCFMQKELLVFTVVMVVSILGWDRKSSTHLVWQ